MPYYCQESVMTRVPNAQDVLIVREGGDSSTVTPNVVGRELLLWYS
jgi:hypothetical protein